MFTSQIIKDNTGQHYIICLRNFSLQTQALKPETFANSQASFQFVTSLQAHFGLWQSLATADSFFDLKNWKNSHPHLSIEHYVAQALVQGNVLVYKTANLQAVKQAQRNDSVKNEFGRTYQLQPAANLLLLNNVDKKTIQNKAEAQAFINQLNLSTEEIKGLNQSYDLPPTGDPTTTLQSALVSGKVAVTILPDTKKPQKVTEYIEEVINAAEPEPAQTEERPNNIPVSNEDADNGDADALTKAAEAGTPFCEECEKAKDVA